MLKKWILFEEAKEDFSSVAEKDDADDCTSVDHPKFGFKLLTFADLNQGDGGENAINGERDVSEFHEKDGFPEAGFVSDVADLLFPVMVFIEEKMFDGDPNQIEGTNGLEPPESHDECGKKDGDRPENESTTQAINKGFTPEFLRQMAHHDREDKSVIGGEESFQKDEHPDDGDVGDLKDLLGDHGRLDSRKA